MPEPLVIGRTATPVASRQAGFVNEKKIKLPVTYRHDSKAGVLSVLKRLVGLVV